MPEANTTTDPVAQSTGDTQPTGNDPKPTENGTNPQSKNEELTIPKHRYDEVAKKARELEDWKKEQESKAKQAEEERLKKQGEWEKLAQSREQEAREAREQLILEKTNNRLILESSKLGVVDSDAVLKLIDRNMLSIDSEGNISGVTEAITALLNDKPYLKGGINQPTVGNGTNPSNPTQQPVTRFKASQLKDHAFFMQHEKEIRQALRLGLIEDDE